MFCIGCIISIVDECKAFGFTQAKIVETFLKGIDEKSGEIDNETASNLARGVKNPSGYVMDALTAITLNEYEKLTVYFREKIVPLIKENERELVRDTLILLIQDASEINARLPSSRTYNEDHHKAVAFRHNVGTLHSSVYLHAQHSRQDFSRHCARHLGRFCHAGTADSVHSFADFPVEL